MNKVLSSVDPDLSSLAVKDLDPTITGPLSQMEPPSCWTELLEFFERPYAVGLG